MVKKEMLALGRHRSVIREIFEYGCRRKAEIGADKVFDFSLGNPSIPAPPAVAETVKTLTDTVDPAVLHGYTSAAGDPATRKAVADYITRTFGFPADAMHVYMTAGAAASLTATLTALVGAGDEVITLAPFFPEYTVFIERTGAVMRPVMCREGDFGLDMAALAAAINENTAAIIVNSPNNPTGAVLDEADIKALSALLRKKEKAFGHPIYLIADEPYRELVYDGAKVPYIPSYYADTVLCYSFSKSLSLPGERIGYVAVNPACKDAALIVDMCGQISRGIGHNCPSSIIQLAVSELLDYTSDLQVYETNMHILYDALTEMGYSCVKPDGTFYMFPKSLEPDAVAFCNKAKEFDLLLVPGDGFGCPGHFRMAYCVPTEKVERSLEAFRKLADYYKNK